MMDPCFSHGRACPGMRGYIGGLETIEEAGIVVQKSNAEGWARACDSVEYRLKRRVRVSEWRGRRSVTRERLSLD